MDVRAKTIVVTGAGRGIGRALATHFARKGANLAVLDTDAAGAEETRQLCAEAGGQRAQLRRRRGPRGQRDRHARPGDGRLRPYRRSGEQRRHCARCHAGEGQGRRGGRQDDAGAVAGGDRCQPHRRFPVRARGGRAHGSRRARRRDRQHLEHLARRQCRTDELQRRQGRRRRHDGGMGQGTGALRDPRGRGGPGLHSHPHGRGQ